MERYIGLDVHAESCTLAVVSPTGRQLKQEVVETNGAALKQALRATPGPKRICLEEGTQSAWLYELLRSEVEDVVVTMPGKHPGPKDDARDALMLAESLRNGANLRRVYKGIGPYSELRAAVRSYSMLRSDVKRNKSRLKALFRRFRTKRQSWAYCGLAIVMRSSADWTKDRTGKWVRAQTQHSLGLNRNRCGTLKEVFKGAAHLVATQMKSHPLHQDYQRLLAGGLKPNLAMVTIARRIAAAVLAMWKHEEAYDPEKHRSQTTAEA